MDHASDNSHNIHCLLINHTNILIVGENHEITIFTRLLKSSNC